MLCLVESASVTVYQVIERSRVRSVRRRDDSGGGAVTISGRHLPLQELFYRGIALAFVIRRRGRLVFPQGPVTGREVFFSRDKQSGAAARGD